MSSELFEPTVLDGLARKTEAIQRKRKVGGKELLDMALFDGDQSFNGMSMQLMRRDGLDISKQALHQRHHSNMTKFVQAVFEQLIAVELPQEQTQGLEIRIKDSTRFALPEVIAETFPGTKGSGMKAGASVQFEFEIKSGKSDIKVTPANANDQGESHLDKASIQPGVLYMRDLGYTHLSYMNNINKVKAFFINKLCPKTTIYLLKDDQYQKLELSKLQGITGVFDQQVYIGADKMPVRIIIEPVSEELKARRIANTEKYNKKKGSTTSKGFKERAGFNFIVTNLVSEKYSAELIQKLYHLRWQIELVFKAWKSFLKIHTFPKGSSDRITSILYSKLIWAVLSWKICMAIGKIGQISVLKVHRLIASTKEELRAQSFRDMLKVVSSVGEIKLKAPFKRAQKT
ncbi:IS4 family transposase [Mucilaginibacter paludis]|uniref:Transposase IS4 family protein n=1 Tax=Mucilaginibacter paludis DSM 18603 TaxID=714943 RepID=H1Y9G0_9SPHI|nr:IS4 family transposase [Mucilaginibacter paludis]EHQ29965.1 transposase IS4 family protein [Mucilaginibacter paludis DSM 18603]